MTKPSSVLWLSEGTLERLADEIVSQGFSIRPSGLAESTCSNLLADAKRLDERRLLRPACIGRERSKIADIRGDRILWLKRGLTPATDSFLQMADRLGIYLNRHLYLGLVEYEGHLACYGPGTGYKKHLDRLTGSEARVLTLILYLNADWDNEDGGQLCLYLKDKSCVNIAPRAGTLVAFLSGDLWHEVLPSRRERWAITGWFRQRVI